MLAKGRYEEATDSFRMAIELDPGSAESWFGMGLSYKALGNYTMAVDCFDEALRLNPDYTEAQAERIEALLLM